MEEIENESALSVLLVKEREEGRFVVGALLSDVSGLLD